MVWSVLPVALLFLLPPFQRIKKRKKKKRATVVIIPSQSVCVLYDIVCSMKFLPFPPPPSCESDQQD